MPTRLRLEEVARGVYVCPRYGRTYAFDARPDRPAQSAAHDAPPPSRRVPARRACVATLGMILGWMEVTVPDVHDGHGTAEPESGAWFTSRTATRPACWSSRATRPRRRTPATASTRTLPRFPPRSASRSGRSHDYLRLSPPPSARSPAWRPSRTSALPSHKPPRHHGTAPAWSRCRACVRLRARLTLTTRISLHPSRHLAHALVKRTESRSGRHPLISVFRLGRPTRACPRRRPWPILASAPRRCCSSPSPPPQHRKPRRRPRSARRSSVQARAVRSPRHCGCGARPRPAAGFAVTRRRSPPKWKRSRRRRPDRRLRARGGRKEFLSRGRRDAARTLAGNGRSGPRKRRLAAAGAALDAAVLRSLTRPAGWSAISRRLAAEDSLLVGAEAALTARFSVGEARYVDVLRLRTERLRVQSEQAEALAEARAARVALRGLLGPDRGPGRADRRRRSPRPGRGWNAPCRPLTPIRCSPVRSAVLIARPRWSEPALPARSPRPNSAPASPGRSGVERFGADEGGGGTWAVTSAGP